MRAVLLVLTVALIGILAPSSADAGGIGVFDQTGLHFGDALRDGGGTGKWLDQGGGVEVILGYRKKRLTGRLRLSYAAIIDLDGGVQHAGLVSIGAKLEIFKDLEKPLGLYAVLDMGVSPLVTHLRVFVFADAGVGLRYRITDAITVFGELAAQVRFEKSFTAGPILFAGARFSFD